MAEIPFDLLLFHVCLPVMMEKLSPGRHLKALLLSWLVFWHASYRFLTTSWGNESRLKKAPAEPLHGCLPRMPSMCTMLALARHK